MAYWLANIKSMKIVIAPDSFKESLSAQQVAYTIQQAFIQHLPDADYYTVPMADGGEGTTKSLIDALTGDMVLLQVQDPLGEPVTAKYGLVKETAIIEIAEASGLHLVAKEQRNPEITCSFGTGEMILDALNRGVDKVIVGLGGSATNDGGAGMLTALGVKFLDASGKPVARGGAGLASITTIDSSALHPRVKEVSWLVACDVNNPLTGDFGASAVFGPQKGATLSQLLTLDQALQHYAYKVFNHTQIGVATSAGAGAAGGLGAAFLAFMNATLRPGVDIVADTLNLAEICQNADLVITGEGRLDAQSIAGKTPVGVARIAKAAGAKQVIAIAGCLGDGYEKVYEHGIDAVFDCLNQLQPIEVILSQGAENLRITADSLARLIKNTKG